MSETKKDDLGSALGCLMLFIIPVGIGYWIIKVKHMAVCFGLGLPGIHSSVWSGEHIFPVQIYDCGGSWLTNTLECKIKSDSSWISSLHYDAYQVSKKEVVKVDDGYADAPVISLGEPTKFRIKFHNIADVDSLNLYGSYLNERL